MDALTVRGLCKTYPAFRLENVSFSLPEGSIMGFIGVNGAGKTTTLKALMGYVHPDKGKISVFGQDFSQDDSEVRQQIGFVSGGVDYFTRKKIAAITAATRAFYQNWDQSAYKQYLTEICRCKSRIGKSASYRLCRSVYEISCQLIEFCSCQIHIKVFRSFGSCRNERKVDICCCCGRKFFFCFLCRFF